MKNRKLWLLVGGILLVLVLAVTPLMAGCAAPAEEEKPPVEEEKPPEKVFELVYSSIVPETNTCWLAYTLFMDNVEKKTNGRVLFTGRYHSGQLFGGFDVLTGIGRGGCDMAAVFGAFNPGELDMLSGLGLPLTSDNGGKELLVKTEMLKTNPLLIEEATRNNIRYQAAIVTGYWHLATVDKPITKLEDLEGLTLYAAGSHAVLVGEWGGAAVQLGLTEVYEAAERGLIDGIIHVLADVYALREYEVCKYFTEIGLGPWNVTMTNAVNLDTWNSLPPDIQKIIDEELVATVPYVFELQRKNDAEQVEVFREAGMILSTFPPEEIAKVRALAPAIVDAWVNLKPEEAAARQQFAQDFLDRVAKATAPAEWAYDPTVLFK